MKKKIVVRLSMNDEKSRSKALKKVVSVPGVESVALSGAEKDELVVVGEDIDAVEMTRQLRKNVGCTELLSVGDDKKEEKPAAVTVEAPPPQPALVWTYAPPSNGYSACYPICEFTRPSPDPPCTIM